MKKIKFREGIIRFASLLFAFTILGIISTINAQQVDTSQKEVKELTQQKLDAKNSDLEDVQVTFEGTTNPALHIDVSKITKRNSDTSKSIYNLYGIVSNKSNKTYSFTVRANFYNSNGYMYGTSSYRLVNVRPNEEESFYATAYSIIYKPAKVELYIENDIDIYDNVNENDIKVDLKKIEYTTDSYGSNRKTKITANITNNSNYLIEELGVKFSLRDKNSKVINIIGSSNCGSYNISDLGVGETRQIVVEGSGIYEDEYSFYKTNIDTYKKTNCNINNIIFSKKSPQYINKEIEIDTDLNSSSSNNEYKYSIYDGSSWTTLRTWNTQSKFIWKPTFEGNYKIKVEVRSYNSSKIKATKTVNYEVVDSKLGNLSVTLSKQSPQLAGSSINITASSTGENVQYKFEIKKGSTTIVNKNYSTQSVYNWIPSEEGTYTINVYSRNKNYTDLYNKQTFTYKVTKPSLSIQSLTVDKKQPQPTESTLKLTAKASGSNLLYKFSYYDGKKWNTIKDYSSSKTISWKPTVAGKLEVKVSVKVKNTSYSTSKTIDYEIFKKGTVTIKSLTANKKSPQPQNASITLTTTAVGSNLQYKYIVYNGKKWVTLRDYSSSSKYTWKPKTPYSKYKIKVYVKSKNSTKSYTKEINYNIFKTGGVSITSLKSSKTSKILQYDTLKISASAKGKYLEYRFKSYDPSTKRWYVEQNFSTSKSFYYYPYSAGTNKIKVEVRQRGCSKIYSKTISLKVYSKPSLSVSGKFYYNWYGSSKYLNYGYHDIYNYGNKTVKIKKLEMITNGSVVYKYSPKSFNISGYGYNTLWYYPEYNEKSTSEYINTSTYWKLTYQYDGLTHVHYMYQQ